MAEPERGVPDAVLLEAVHEANQLVSVIDDTGVIVYVNRAFETQFGWSPDEVLGRTALEFVHPDDVERAAAGLAILDQTTLSVPTAFRLLRADGDYSVLDVGSTLLTVDGRQWMVFDLTPIPFHDTTARTLAVLAARGSADEALDVLAHARIPPARTPRSSSSGTRRPT
jgi:PAS domain S-box-containing protein